VHGVQAHPESIWDKVTTFSFVDVIRLDDAALLATP
jgi:hypothetical protein